MIWEAIFGAFFDAVGAVLGVVFGLVPSPPDWIDDADLEEIADAVGGVGQWIPVEYALSVASGVVTAYLTAGMIGIGRSAVSLFTGGGGAS